MVCKFSVRMNESFASVAQADRSNRMWSEVFRLVRNMTVSITN